MGHSQPMVYVEKSQLAPHAISSESITPMNQKTHEFAKAIAPR